MADTSAAPAPFGLSAIGQIALSVTDLGRALAFYRDTLGMKLLFQFPNMAFFDCGGIRLMLSGSQPPTAISSTVLYFRVPDIHDAFTVISQRNAAIEREPHLLARMPDHELWMAFFRDPDGNLLALMSEVPTPAAA
jgi:methylmalonyl-CoA/ethylmalonyl-CoA epimerase